VLQAIFSSRKMQRKRKFDVGGKKLNHSSLFRWVSWFISSHAGFFVLCVIWLERSGIVEQ
jgi:hypothetical protein